VTWPKKEKKSKNGSKRKNTKEVDDAQGASTIANMFSGNDILTHVFLYSAHQQARENTRQGI